MKKSFSLPVLAAIAMVCASAVSANAASDKRQIVALEHKLMAATNVDQAMACFDPKDITLYDFQPPLKYAGEAAVRKDFTEFFANTKNIKGRFLELNVVTDGRLGIVNSIQHFTWTDKNGKPEAGNFRVTDCLHKVEGQWKIFHSHISVPVDPATGKAVMDAKM